MRRWLIIACMLLPLCVKAQTIDSTALHLDASYSDTLQASLVWNAVAPAVQYQVFRKMPSQDDFNLLASTSATTYVDTIHQIVCGDTVRYRIECQREGVHYISNIDGDYFSDLYPTAPCTLGGVTVDSATQLITIFWHPSPDSDIEGYHLCSGSPCLAYDTIWGRLDTVYRCLEYASTEVHEFRLLAFDSCRNASPLAPFYGSIHNIVLQLNTTECSRTIQAAWNAYDNMPDDLRHYQLWLGYDDAAMRPVDSLTACALSYEIPGWVSRLRAKVVAVNTTGSCCVESNMVQVQFATADTALYITLDDPVYDEEHAQITLCGSVDPQYQIESYTLYRSIDRGAFLPLAQLPYAADGQLRYVDGDVHRHDSCYAYRLSVLDGCHRNEKFSNTVQLLLPEVGESAVFFPNVFTPGQPDNNRFGPIAANLETSDYSFHIFDRLGRRLFSTTQLGDMWDGTYHGVAMPQGAYVYYLRCRHTNGRILTYKGTVTLLR